MLFFLFIYTFDEDGIHDEFIKDKNCRIIDAQLSYIPSYCDKCGCVFESTDDYEKKGFDDGSYIVVPTIFKMTCFLFLKKQRILCHHCKKRCYVGFMSTLDNFDISLIVEDVLNS